MYLDLHHKNKTIQPNQPAEIIQDTLSIVSANITTLANERPKFKSVSRNRKKKEKLKVKRQEAKEGLEDIIKNMYRLKTDFRKNYDTINELLEIDLDEDRFYQFINKIIREEVDELANCIHTHTQNFCKLYRDDSAINPTEIAQLYELVDTVKQASVEVEKMINLFILKVEQVENEEYLHRHLDLSTLKYIFKLDPFKEDFEHFCCTFITQTKDKKQKILIQSILKSFKNAEDFIEINDENDDLECYEEYDDQATLSYQDPKKKKKKRNKRKQEQQIKEMTLVQQIQAANLVVRNLEEFGFNEAIRTNCYCEKEWLDECIQKNKKKMQGHKIKAQHPLINDVEINDCNTNK